MSRCITVRKNLRAREIQGDICCARCGADEESINHVFFECSSNTSFGPFQRYLQIQSFFQQAPSLQIWIISFGEFSRRWIIISLHGLYGTFGKGGITKFSVIWTLIPGTRLNWQKQNLHFGLMHIY